MKTSALIFGILATFIAVGLLFANPDSDSAPKERFTPPSVSAASLDEDPNPAQKGPAQPVWLDNLELATSIAAESDRPLMVVFR
jgi:hypothetical protein